MSKKQLEKAFKEAMRLLERANEAMHNRLTTDEERVIGQDLWWLKLQLAVSSGEWKPEEAGAWECDPELWADDEAPTHFLHDPIYSNNDAIGLVYRSDGEKRWSWTVFESHRTGFAKTEAGAKKAVARALRKLLESPIPTEFRHDDR